MVEDLTLINTCPWPGVGTGTSVKTAVLSPGKTRPVIVFCMILS